MKKDWIDLAKNISQNSIDNNTETSAKVLDNQNENSNNGSNKVLKIFLLILATVGTAGIIGYKVGARKNKI